MAKPSISILRLPAVSPSVEELRQFSMDDPYGFLAYWINERWSIHVRREAGLPKPWTRDPVLLRYRFCNVHRENDTTTRWINQEWTQKHRKHQHQWFAMTMARLFNHVPTLALLGYPKHPGLDWVQNLAEIRGKLHSAAAARKKVFTSAYIISTGGQRVCKINYVTAQLAHIWSVHGMRSSHPIQGDSLSVAHTKLKAMKGLGSFLAGQIVADLKYDGGILADARDWWTWSCPGPGSMRGLNRLLGRRLTLPFHQAQFAENLLLLNARLKPRLHKGMPPLCAQNLQNCLCEYDKMCRVVRGEGRPRQTYPGE